MRPFDVERLLEFPAGVGSASGEIQDSEVGVGQLECSIEGLQIGRQGWIVVGLDQGDGLAGAVARHGRACRCSERDGVEAVSMGQLRGSDPTEGNDHPVCRGLADVRSVGSSSVVLLMLGREVMSTERE